MRFAWWSSLGFLMEGGGLDFADRFMAFLNCLVPLMVRQLSEISHLLHDRLDQCEIARDRLGNIVLFDICEHENSTRAQNIKFLLDGVLKESMQFKITVFPVVQEVRTSGLGVLTDAVTENLLLIAGSSERFELYYGVDGKPRAYSVKMLVMTFRSACVRFQGPR